MRPDTLSARTIVFVNIAHAFDHFILLIYPTAVIAIAAQQGVDYASLINLATGAFVAFGLFSLPMGWIADHIGRRNLLAVFFLGYGASCAGLAVAETPTAFAVGLLVVGIFSAIYHPIGSAMLVSHARQLGRDLGWNGVWGNLGAASASAVTAVVAATLGWRWAFLLPGLVSVIVGTAFLALVPGDGDTTCRPGGGAKPIGTSRPILVLSVLAAAIVAGGVTFNVTTIALPKVIDERMSFGLPLTIIGALATVVFVFGALTQLLMGRLIDRYSLPSIFVGLSALQPIGLAVAAASTGVPLLIGLFIITSAIYGQVVINDAMVARYVPAHYRTKAYSVRYFLGFTASGFAAPMIALLYARGGFPVVLGTTAVFGGAVVLCAIAFKLLSYDQTLPSMVAAE
jgi:MFS family permease